MCANARLHAVEYRTSRREAPNVREAGNKWNSQIQGERKTMRSRQHLKYLVLFSLLLLVICGATNAQSIVTGAVSGTITDASGAVVADAKVSLVSEATQETQTAVTGPAGTYQFPLLKPGKYSVTVDKAGFRRIVDKSEVLLGQTTTINAKLEIGEATQTIEIIGSAPLLQTEDGNIASNVDLRTLQNIPNPGGASGLVGESFYHQWE